MILKTIIESLWPSLWPKLLFICIVYLTLRLAYLFKGSKKIVIYQEVLNLLFIVYVVCLYYVLTYDDGGSGVNLIPFKEIFRYQFGSYKFFKNIIGNILLFVPFGFFTSYFLNTNKATRPLIVSLIVSGSAEWIQYHIGRIFDIDDIILNVIGGLCGYLLYVALSAIRSKLPKFMRSDAFLNILVILIIICVVLFSLNVNILSYL